MSAQEYVHLVEERRLKASQVSGKSLIISTDREETWRYNGRRNEKFRTKAEIRNIDIKETIENGCLGLEVVN